MNDPSDRRQWHLDKTVSITHIFSTVAAIATLVVLGARFDTRLSLVEQAVIVQHASEIRQDQEMAESRRELRESIKAINEKLDRLIERGR